MILKKKDEKKQETNPTEEVAAKEVSTENVTDKMNKALELVFKTFDLEDKGYVMTGFKDKNKSCELELTNGDFALRVTISDCEKFGIVRADVSEEVSDDEESEVKE